METSILWKKSVDPIRWFNSNGTSFVKQINDIILNHQVMPINIINYIMMIKVIYIKITNWITIRW
jgi:hypothetical protein